MTRTTVTRSINAPPERVFRTVAHISEFSKAIPHIEKVEFLTGPTTGVGTRFRETRLMKEKRMVTELEVKEYMENDRVRIVSDSRGTIWDTLFTVKPEGSGSLLTLTMDAIPGNLVSGIMILMIKGMLKKAIEADMDSVKSYCEQRSTT